MIQKLQAATFSGPCGIKFLPSVCKITASGRNPAMQDTFLTFINQQQLFGPTDSVLLTVSGGIDSVVMADLFRLHNFRYGVAHVNFSLRGAESDEDEAFVRNLAEKHGVPFHTTRFDTAKVATAKGVSIQMAARQLRYQWFEQTAAAHGYDYIATAHHADDNLETVLLNLVRGTGLTGLKGISARYGRVIRPLLYASREEIEAYAAQQGLDWREDSSNADDKYYRNRLRHHVVPVLKELNPNLLETIGQTYRAAQAADTLLNQELRRSWGQIVGNKGEFITLNISQLCSLTEWEYQLGEWLKPFGFRTAQLSDIESAVCRESFGQVFESGTHRLTRDRNELVISAKEVIHDEGLVQIGPADTRVDLPDKTSLILAVQPKPTDFVIPVLPNTVYIDATKITWPLTLRTWQAGDRFRPLGMKGTQKISDYLTNRKVSRIERLQARVLLSGNKIVWLVGYRLDDFFRVTEKTDQLLCVTMIDS